MRRLIWVASAMVGWSGVQGATPTLAERLGYAATNRLVIINGDDAGMCHAANVATIESLERGSMTSATVMVPCPWFLEMAEYGRTHPQADLGIHLTHTSEWKRYRWGSVAPRDQVPGLIDPQGYLWASVEEVYAHATPDEAYRESKAQVDRAIAAGMDLTHLDSHMGTMQLDPRYLAMYVRLGREYRLPLRMASQSLFEKHGLPELRLQIAAQGIVFPDYLIHEELSEAKGRVRDFWKETLRALKSGVTELYIHAAQPTEELQAITGSWQTRGEEFQVFTHDPDVRQLLAEEGIIRIGYRPLRELQRKGDR